MPRGACGKPTAKFRKLSKPYTAMNASIPQGTLVFPVEPISFGRTKLGIGQSLWVSNSRLDQTARNVIELARSGRNSASATAFSAADVFKFFTWEGKPSANV